MITVDEEDFHEVEYQYVWNVMETPIQTLIDFAEKVSITVTMINDIRNHLRDSEEFVHPQEEIYEP